MTSDLVLIALLLATAAPQGGMVRNGEQLAVTVSDAGTESGGRRAFALSIEDLDSGAKRVARISTRARSIDDVLIMRERRGRRLVVIAHPTQVLAEVIVVDAENTVEMVRYQARDLVIDAVAKRLTFVDPGTGAEVSLDASLRAEHVWSEAQGISHLLRAGQSAERYGAARRIATRPRLQVDAGVRLAVVDELVRVVSEPLPLAPEVEAYLQDLLRAERLMVSAVPPIDAMLRRRVAAPVLRVLSQPGTAATITEAVQLGGVLAPPELLARIRQLADNADAVTALGIAGAADCRGIQETARRVLAQGVPAQGR